MKNLSTSVQHFHANIYENDLISNIASIEEF